jgi:ABC-type transport system substrate-binding protein
MLTIALSMLGSPTTAAPVQALPSNLDREKVFDWTSGYADEIYFRVITGSEQQVLALRAGQIDLIGQFIDPEQVEPLLADPLIETNQTNRKGFGHLSFNCEDPITSHQELRQAFAFALDKDGIQTRALGGYSRPADSPIVPSMGFWSLDNQPFFTTNYYEADPAAGNALLGPTDSGYWADTDSDSYREANGVAFDIPVYGSSAGSSIIETVVAMAVEAFTSIHIKSHVELIDFNTLLAKVDAGDFQIGFWAFSGFGVDPLFLENFQSTDANNDWNWANATYDQLVADLMQTSSLVVAKQKCWAAQQILWREQPLVVAYQNLLISAYRKDPWTGYVNTNGQGVFDTWTLLKVYLKPEYGGDTEDYLDYKQGGRFTISLPQDMESTNILNSQSAYTYMVLNLVYDGLYGRNPYNLEDGAGLAKNWKVEEITGSTEYPTDKLKITYYLNSGWKWHDNGGAHGGDVSADDVVFSYRMIKEAGGTGAAIYMGSVKDVSHVLAVNATTVEIYCTEAGLFTFHKCGWPIWPQHIWEPIGMANILTWSNPNPVGSGPYKWKSRTPGELVVVSRNDDYFYNARNYDWANRTYVPPVTNTSTSTTTTTTKTAITVPTTIPASPGYELLSLLAGVATIILFNNRRRR